MELDAELLSDFATEMKQLQGELGAAVRSLKGNPDQPAQFEKFAQVIDRIYGTAATFGFTELAAYCGMLKKTCYECARSNNKRAQPKVLSLMETCMASLDSLIAGVHDVEVTKKIKHTLHIEGQKAARMHEEIFQYTKKSA